jgi:hypothetical protein
MWQILTSRIYRNFILKLFNYLNNLNSYTAFTQTVSQCLLESQASFMSVGNWSTARRKQKMSSEIDLSLRNPRWWSPIISSTYLVKLKTRDSLRIGVRFLEYEEIFLNIQTAPGAQTSFNLTCAGSSFSGSKEAGAWSLAPNLISGCYNFTWSYTSTPSYVVMAWCLIEYRGKSTFCGVKFERRIRSSHSCGYEEFYHMGHNAVWSGENQPTFQRNKSPSSSGSKSKPSKKPAWRRQQDVFWLSPDCTALYPKDTTLLERRNLDNIIM